MLYRAEGQTNGSLYTTGKHSIDLPIMKGQYLVEVRAHSAGGDGAVAQLRVSGNRSRSELISLSACLAFDPHEVVL